MSTTPAFVVTPRIGMGQVSAANTGRDGTGTLVDIITGTASPNYTKILEVVIEATVTTTAGMVRLFLNDGTNTRLFDEFPITAITVSASVAAYRTTKTYENLVLPSASWVLKASTHNAEAINVFALAADM